MQENKYSDDQPMQGEIILGCGHMKEVEIWGWFQIPKGIRFERPDGSFDVATWVVQCKACAPTPSEDGSYTSENFKIFEDFVWQTNIPILKDQNDED